MKKPRKTSAQKAYEAAELAEREIERQRGLIEELNKALDKRDGLGKTYTVEKDAGGGG